MHRVGPELFDIDSANNNEEMPKRNIHYTMVFTAFVFMTLFNELNARKVHGERNIFSGLLSNYIFLAIWTGTLIFTVGIHTRAALPDNNAAAAELTTANGGTFTSSSARLSSQSRYRSLDQ